MESVITITSIHLSRLRAYGHDSWFNSRIMVPIYNLCGVRVMYRSWQRPNMHLKSRHNLYWSGIGRGHRGPSCNSRGRPQSSRNVHGSYGGSRDPQCLRPHSGRSRPIIQMGIFNWRGSGYCWMEANLHQGEWTLRSTSNRGSQYCGRIRDNRSQLSRDVEAGELLMTL